MPKTIVKTGKFFASLPGEWIGAVKDLATDLKEDAKPHVPLPPQEMPDLTKYDPIEGIDFNGFVHISFLPGHSEQFGTTFPSSAAMSIRNGGTG